MPCEQTGEGGDAHPDRRFNDLLHFGDVAPGSGNLKVILSVIAVD